MGSKIHFQLALQDAIAAGPEVRFLGKSRLPAKPIVANSVGDVFGQVVQLGKGTVWVLPQTHDNPAVVALFASRIEQLKTIRIEEPRASITPAPTAVAGVPTAPQDFWKDLHPEIVKVAKSRFETGHYADAIEASLKEVNDRVRALVKKQVGQELDGKDFMERAFSVKNPVLALDDLSTVSVRNIQVGYMQIFAGSMTGIRNPKAHANITIERLRAIHFLYLASLLMHRVDEATLVKHHGT